MKINELHNQPVQPDTYEASMALNQLLKIGKHAIKIHNMIDDSAEMEAWVAKKIDLAGDYVKKVHGYMQGEKAGLYDDGGMTEARLQSNWAVSFQMPKGNHRRNSFASKDDAIKFANTVKSKGGTVDSMKLALGKNADDLSTSVKSLEMKKMPKGTGTMQGVKESREEISKFDEDAPFGSGMELLRMAIMKKFISVQEWDLLKHKWKAAAEEVEEKYSDWPEGEGFGSSDHNFAIKDLMTAVGYEFDDKDTSGRFVVTKQPEEIEKAGIKNARMKGVKDPEQDHREISRIMKYEDAGEGHMSKSQLYQTAKMAIELLDMIRKGDDLEGWVQTKLNLAADYLQAVYHYEDYQKLNPYREELDGALMQKHAGIIQKHLDEILERKCKAEDVDTKPGMMRILKKRVNEVEKEIAKENRKQTDEAALEEGKIKDWAKSLAMAGIFVAGLAGVGSINDAINNSVPAIQAMNTALEMAKEKGDDNLVAQIEKDLKGAKLRLDIGKDLNQVKYLQDKYEKFIATESLAYESKLAMMLNQHIK